MTHHFGILVSQSLACGGWGSTGWAILVLCGGPLSSGGAPAAVLNIPPPAQHGRRWACATPTTSSPSPSAPPSLGLMGYDSVSIEYFIGKIFLTTKQE